MLEHEIRINTISVVMINILITFYFVRRRGILKFNIVLTKFI